MAARVRLDCNRSTIYSLQNYYKIMEYFFRESLRKKCSLASQTPPCSLLVQRVQISRQSPRKCRVNKRLNFILHLRSQMVKIVVALETSSKRRVFYYYSHGIRRLQDSPWGKRYFAFPSWLLKEAAGHDEAAAFGGGGEGGRKEGNKGRAVRGTQLETDQR